MGRPDAPVGLLLTGTAEDEATWTDPRVFSCDSQEYVEQGAVGESILHIMGQVNSTDLTLSVQMAWDGRVVQCKARQSFLAHRHFW